MKKITISKEGISPIDILVGNDGKIKSVESAGKNLISTDDEYTENPDATFSIESAVDFSGMSAVDRLFAEAIKSKESATMSTEAYGASIWKTRTWNKFEDMYNDPKFGKVIEKVKAWYAKNNLRPAMKEDIKAAVEQATKNIEGTKKIKLSNKYTWKWLKKDDVTFLVLVGGKASFKSAIIPVVNLFTAFASFVNHANKDETMCYVYPLGINKDNTPVIGIAIYNAAVPASEKYNGKNTDKDE